MSKEEMKNKLNQLTEKDLETVNGGAGVGSYQLTYKGQNLPMNSTISSLCVTYPELKEALGDMYNQVANYTLNFLCMMFGESTIQGLIDANTK